MDSSTEWTHPSNMPYFLSGNMWLTINWTIGDLMAASSYKQKLYTTQDFHRVVSMLVSQMTFRPLILLLFVFILLFLLLKLLKVNL